MSDKKPFTEIQDKLRVLAKRNPERNAACQYFTTENDGTSKPCCIVGHVLADLGVTEVQVPGELPIDYHLATAEGGFLIKSRQGVRAIDWNMLGVKMPTEAQKQWTARLQECQDSGLSWGEALEKAEAA